MHRIWKLHLIGEEKCYTDFVMSAEFLCPFKTFLPSHLQQIDSFVKVLGYKPIIGYVVSDVLLKFVDFVMCYMHILLFNCVVIAAASNNVKEHIISSVQKYVINIKIVGV